MEAELKLYDHVEFLAPNTNEAHNEFQRPNLSKNHDQRRNKAIHWNFKTNFKSPKSKKKNAAKVSNYLLHRHKPSIELLFILNFVIYFISIVEKPSDKSWQKSVGSIHAETTKKIT